MTSPRGLPPRRPEQQLHQLSLRHTLQAQITAHTEQITQLQQHIDQRQATLTAELARHGLSLPAEGEVASWLSERANEAQMWQQRQNELTELQARIAQLAPVLETLPETDALGENIESVAGKLAAGARRLPLFTGAVANLTAAGGAGGSARCRNSGAV